VYQPQFHRFISEFSRQWSKFFAEKIFAGNVFRANIFLRIAEKTAKIAKIRTRKKFSATWYHLKKLLSSYR